MEHMVGCFPIGFSSEPEACLADLIKAKSPKMMARFLTHSDEETVSQMLSAKVDGMPMLTIAVLFHERGTLRELLMRSSSLEIKGDMPLYLPLKKKVYCGVSALWAAARLGNFSALSDLQDAGADMKTRSSKGVSAGLASVMSGNLNCLEVFLEATLFDAFGRDGKRRNALMLAVCQQDVGLTESLLDSWQCARVIYGDDAYIEGGINATDKDGNTALHISSMKSGEDVCRLLIHHGATVKVNKRGLTPSMLASLRGFARLASLLVDPDIDTLEHVGVARLLQWQISREYGGDPFFWPHVVGVKGPIAQAAADVRPMNAPEGRRSATQVRVDMVVAADRITGSSFVTSRCALDLAQCLGRASFVTESLCVLHAVLATLRSQSLWSQSERREIFADTLGVLTSLSEKRTTQPISENVLSEVFQLIVECAALTKFNKGYSATHAIVSGLSELLLLCGSIESTERLVWTCKEYFKSVQKKRACQPDDEDLRNRDRLPFHALFTSQNLSTQDPQRRSGSMFQVAKLLLEAGIDPNASDEYSRSTALHAALSSPLSTDETILLLESEGAEIDVANAAGVVPCDTMMFNGRRVLSLKSYSARNLMNRHLSHLPRYVRNYAESRTFQF